MRLQRRNVDQIHTSEDLETEFKEISMQFEVSLSWGLKELGLSSAVHSPIAGVIKHAVIEAYKYRPGLHSELVSEMEIKQAVDTLNVLYVYNRIYEPQYALLVYPLVLNFQSGHLHFQSGRSLLACHELKKCSILPCNDLLKKLPPCLLLSL